MHHFLIGNSGSGKSTLARAWAHSAGARHVDLDTYAWLDAGRTRRELTDAARAVRDALGPGRGVIEGMYADLVEVLLTPEDTLVWIDLPVAQCQAHCRARPYEAHKWESPEAQDAFLPTLLEFVASYPTRDDTLGARAHRALFEGHAGPSLRLTSPAAVAAARDAGLPSP